jgi:predicted nucleic acid-binding protein
MKIVLDTDVIIDFIKGHPKAIGLFDTFHGPVILPSIVVAELYAGAKGDKEIQILDRVISVQRIVDLSKEIAKTAGLYRMKYGKSHGVGLFDAVVAATAQSEDADLKTLNVKHYPMIAGLKPAYKKNE